MPQMDSKATAGGGKGTVAWKLVDGVQPLDSSAAVQHQAPKTQVIVFSTFQDPSPRPPSSPLFSFTLLVLLYVYWVCKIFWLVWFFLKLPSHLLTLLTFEPCLCLSLSGFRFSQLTTCLLNRFDRHPVL
jgi:hypothetical protein